MCLLIWTVCLSMCLFLFVWLLKEWKFQFSCNWEKKTCSSLIHSLPEIYILCPTKEGIEKRGPSTKLWFMPFREIHLLFLIHVCIVKWMLAMIRWRNYTWFVFFLFLPHHPNPGRVTPISSFIPSSLLFFSCSHPFVFIFIPLNYFPRSQKKKKILPNCLVTLATVLL